MSDFEPEPGVPTAPTAPTGAPSAPAGWYAVDDVSQRYWDGYEWTNQMAPRQPAAAAGVPAAATSLGDDKTYATLLHLSTFLFPLLGPLVMWLIKRESSSFIDQHGKQALNFQITMLLAGVVSLVLIFVLIGFFLLLGLFVIGIIFPILAAIAASKGEPYRYPLAIQFLS